MIPPCLIITDFDYDSDRDEMTMMTAVIVIIIIKEMFHTSHCYQTRALTHARMQTHKCVCVYSPLHFHLQLVNHQRNARKPWRCVVPLCQCVHLFHVMGSLLVQWKSQLKKRKEKVGQREGPESPNQLSRMNRFWAFARIRECVGFSGR